MGPSKLIGRVQIHIQRLRWSAMKGQAVFTAAAITALAVPASASAQVPVGGNVPNGIELILTPPTKQFATFSRARTYEMSFETQVVGTVAPLRLSVADGDDVSASARGRISVGSRRLPEPLEATVGRSAFQPLDSAVDPLLARWSDVVARAPATVKLRQKVTSRTRGNYRKRILVTLSTDAP
jgi:hypothetical protein